LMVPMARILVVGVVFIAAPCASAELKPTRQPVIANAAAETISCYLPSVGRSGDRVNSLGEHRLQGSRTATTIASSSMKGQPRLSFLGACREISDGLTLLPLRGRFLVDPVAPSEGFTGLVIARVGPHSATRGARNAEF
jgi:hypothetical protein